MAVSYNQNTDYSVAIAKAKSSGASQKAIEKLERQRAQKIADANDNQLKSWNVNRAGQSLSTPTPVMGPESLNKTEMTTLTYQKCKNDITLKSDDGKTEHVLGYVLNGHSYVLNKNGTGSRLLDYGDGEGLIKADIIEDVDWKTDFHNKTENNVVIDYIGTSLVSLTSTKKEYDPPPRHSERKSFVKFNEEPPTLSSDLEEVHKYSYFFGIDNLELKNAVVNQNCCFISKEISTEDIIQNEDGYIQLEAEFSDTEDTSVEFYIIDGSSLTPILPVGQKLISNEKIFFGYPTRFSMDESKGYGIKKDGTALDITLEKAKQSTDGLYTITYTPTASYDYKPINSSIKIKAILRVYNTNTDAPNISKIKIRKFGGETLWQQITSLQ